MKVIPRTVRPQVTALLLVIFSGIVSQAQNDVAMRAMKDELNRSISQLQLQKMDKPYFIAYRLDDINQIEISAMLGSLTGEQPSHVRLIGVEVRVGDYNLDNSNYVSMQGLAGGMGRMLGSIRQTPLDDDYRELRREFWLATDSQYKTALEDISAKRAVLENRKRSDDLPDFSKESPTSEAEAPANSAADTAQLKDLARDISAEFTATPQISSSSVEISYRNFYSRYANSEGTWFTRSQPLIKLQIHARTQAADGMPISDFIEVYGKHPSDLPTKDILIARTRALSARLVRLLATSALDHYNGPVLFEGDAAGEIFTQQFATGLMAVRTPLSDDSRFDMFFNQMMSQLGGGSFLDKIGGRVLPTFLSVTDNPLLSQYKGVPLFGGNTIDDDGVKSRQTLLVDHGILKTLLATRVPVRGVLHSTGSRRGWGATPSNLLITSDKPLTSAELRKELLRLAKARGLDYAIVVRRVGGGAAGSFMKMAARMAQQGGQGSSSLAEVYKVYADGHEEPLPGMEIADMNASAFKEISAVGDTPVVFTDEFMPRIGAFFSMGISASSNVPVVSCAVPPLLFEEISLVKTQGPFPNPPISPSPLAQK